ncbi:MAG: chloride channel protein, partial [Victivallales bacterium]|nr:chloride channel protein [Victivallales bacterium]
PSVLTGAAIGSNITRFFRLETVPRSVLVGCGGAAAIAGIFDSPIAGVLFVAEGLLPEISVSSLVPIVLSSASSSVISHLLTGHDVFFANSIAQWNGGEIMPAFALGIVCAVIGVAVIRGTGLTAGFMARTFSRPLLRMICGGVALCLLLALFPYLRGQGYAYIERLLTNEAGFVKEAPYSLSFLPPQMLPYIIVLSSIFIKILVSALTIDSGDGGIFAPTLFIGAFTGFAFAHTMNVLGICNVSSANFTALGMCGVFTAVMRTSLAGVFLIAETTGGYKLLVPLMLVSGVAWYVGRLFEPHSIYRKSLFKRHLVADDNDVALLKRLSVGNCIVQLPIALNANDTVNDAEVLIRRNLRNKVDIYPVVNEGGRLIGILPYDKLLSVIVRSTVPGSISVSEIMDLPDGMMHSSDSLDKALAKMEMWHLKYLPVSNHDTGKFMGIASKESIFDRYREMNAEIER